MAKKSPINQAIGDLTIEYMKRERCFRAMWGDGFLVDVACDAGVTVPHPLNKMDKAVSALSRDKRFDMRLTWGHDSRCRQRKVRLFTLREEYRDGIPEL